MALHYEVVSWALWVILGGSSPTPVQAMHAALIYWFSQSCWLRLRLGGLGEHGRVRWVGKVLVSLPNWTDFLVHKLSLASKPHPSVKCGGCLPPINDPELI